MGRFAEVYFGDGSEGKRLEFTRWYLEEHLTHIDALKNNPYIERVQVGLVTVPGIHAMVVIDIADGHEEEVLADPGVQEILERARAHGMQAGAWAPIVVE